MNQLNAKDVLYVFAQYGFQKASMSDLAEAAGVSRQSLYNHFESKEVIFNFVVKSYVQGLYDEAVSVLDSTSKPTTDTLVEAYYIWAGSSIPLLRSTPHGAELLDKAIQNHFEASIDIEEHFAQRIFEFITEKGLIQKDTHNIHDVVYTLTMASKGLLLKSNSEEDFKTGIQRVIETLFK